jgi:DNA-binding NtrC family response regulator
MAGGSLVGIDDLPPGVRSSGEERDIRVPSGSSLAEAEKLLIRETLAAQGGNKSRTAEVLGIGRKTLYQKIEEYGIELPRAAQDRTAPAEREMPAERPAKAEGR